MDVIEALRAIPGLGPVLPYILFFLAFMGIVARWVAPYVRPPSSQYGLYALIYGVMNQLAGNVGQAVNANDPRMKPDA